MCAHPCVRMFQFRSYNMHPAGFLYSCRTRQAQLKVVNPKAGGWFQFGDISGQNSEKLHCLAQIGLILWSLATGT